MISIISTGSIKRTGLAIFPKFLLNVPYDLTSSQVFLNVLVSIKRTGFEKYNTSIFLSTYIFQSDDQTSIISI